MDNSPKTCQDVLSHVRRNIQGTGIDFTVGIRLKMEARDHLEHIPINVPKEIKLRVLEFIIFHC